MLEYPAQHPGSGKRIVQMEGVDPAHQRQSRVRHRLWLIVGRGTSQRQDVALSNDGEGVGSVDHRLALSHPA